MRSAYCLLAIAAAALSLQPAAPTWVHPSAAEYAQAAADGYSASALPKKDRYRLLEFSRTTWTEGTWQITVVPPLTCAMDEAALAYRKLAPEPLTTALATKCDGTIEVDVEHFSPSLNASWPVVLRSAASTEQPSVSAPDRDPTVTSIHVLFSGNVTGYEYLDRYWFSVQGQSAETLVYADDAGKHHSIPLNFRSFAEFERALRSRVVRGQRGQRGQAR